MAERVPGPGWTEVALTPLGSWQAQADVDGLAEILYAAWHAWAARELLVLYPLWSCVLADVKDEFREFAAAMVKRDSALSSPTG